MLNGFSQDFSNISVAELPKPTPGPVRAPFPPPLGGAAAAAAGSFRSPF